MSVSETSAVNDAPTSESASVEPRVAPPIEAREGSDAIALALKACGVEMIFGYTGGSVPHLTRSLLDMSPMGGRTELTAAWMSAAYNRIKGRVASAVVVWNVGAMHASPAIYGATMDGTPLLTLVMDNPPAMESRDGLQDAVEVYSALKPLSKYIRKVTDAADLPVIIRQAVKEASTGKFGASTLLLAQPVMFQKTSMKIEPLTLPKPPSPDAADLDTAWEMIKRAERPILYVGAGVHLGHASSELREFSELTGIPVVSTSWGGRGLLADSDPLYVGPSGAFGWRCANGALQRSDLWISVGASFSQMSTASWSLDKPDDVIQVDVDQWQIGKIFQPALGMQSDAKSFFRDLLSRVHEDAETSAVEASHKPWLSEVQESKAEWLVEMDSWFTGTEVPINQYFLIRTLSEQLPDDALVTADSGVNAFAMYRAFQYKDRPTPLATGGHYMSLGNGLPSAIGAKLAAPDRTVVSFHGDGGFYYDLMELSNLREKGLKVIVVLDNNGCLIANRSTMKLSGYDNPWVDLPQTTDFVTVAKGLGVDGERVEKPEDLVDAIHRALAAEGSYLLDVRTDPGFRIRRAVTDLIPVVGDRTPKRGHLETVLDGSWPS